MLTRLMLIRSQIVNQTESMETDHIDFISQKLFKFKVYLAEDVAACWSEILAALIA
jgi:hypothetical protein